MQASTQGDAGGSQHHLRVPLRKNQQQADNQTQK
jgi:hypothetical protein